MNSNNLKCIYKISIILLAIMETTSCVTHRAAQKKLEDEVSSRNRVLLMYALYGYIAASNEAGHMTQIMKLGNHMAVVLGIQQFDVFDEQGTIVWSLLPESVGKKIQFVHYQSYIYNKIKGNIYRVNPYHAPSEGGEWICLVRPLFNQTTCMGCHDKTKRVLGILNICTSSLPK